MPTQHIFSLLNKNLVINYTKCKITGLFLENENGRWPWRRRDTMSNARRPSEWPSPAAPRPKPRPKLRKGRKKTSVQARMPRHSGFTRRPGPRPPSTGSRCYPPVPSASSLALSIMPCFFPFTCPHHPKCLKWGGTRDSGQLEHRPPAKVFDSPVPTFLFPLLDAITKK